MTYCVRRSVSFVIRQLPKSGLLSIQYAHTYSVRWACDSLRTGNVQRNLREHGLLRHPLERRASGVRSANRRQQRRCVLPGARGIVQRTFKTCDWHNHVCYYILLSFSKLVENVEIDAVAEVLYKHKVRMVRSHYCYRAGRLSAVFLLAVDDSRFTVCLLYTSPSPRDKRQSRMPSSA